MYWSRTGSLLDIFIFLILSLCWITGGWLLVIQSGRFHKRESLTFGIASGLLLYILLSNAFAQILPAYPAFALSAILILFAGLWAARSSLRQCLALINPKILWQALPLIAMTGFFTLMMRGLGVGDDYAHLPLISVMAAGDIPPLYSLFPKAYLPYHYGLDLFAAVMVKVGGFFPWSAWDVSRAFVVPLTLACAWLWLRRITRSVLAAWLGAVLIAFGMGTRWLLTLLPASVLVHISSEVTLIGSSVATGKTLAEALFRSWVIDGGPPVPFPYAFANGILNPLTYDWAGASSLPLLAILLIFMLAGRRSLKPVGILLLGSAVLSLALSAEHIFVLLELGVGMTALILIFRQKLSFRQIFSSFPGQFLLVVLSAGVFSLVQGGVITEIARSLFTGRQGAGAAASGSFSLRWPPAFYDGHMGSLSLLNWAQFAVILAEAGPILLLFPVVFSRMKHDLRHSRILEFGFGIASFLGVFIPLFVNYAVARDIVRLTGFGLSAWLLLSIQPLWVIFKRASLWKNISIGIGYAIAIFGGIALFACQTTAIFSPQVSSFVTSMDSRISQTYWNKLTPHVMVFDPIGFRGQTLFGRLSVDAINGFPSSRFVPYLNAPNPNELQKLGFDYIYFDKRYWDHLSPAYQRGLYTSCTQVMKRLEKYNSATAELSDFRVLIDIANCK